MAPATRTAPEEGNNKANEGTTFVIPPAALKAFISVITGAITSAVAIAISNAPPARLNANAKNISSEIDPYDTKSMYLTSKGGTFQW